ncbi:HNH endonuclease [Streptomyces sp. NPDC057910]|uniref:HNH endonuclease n=1 Tax=Streptomyces sp. NPDC057910 TaxID=3346278 RepID=UPI0036E60812
MAQETASDTGIDAAELFATAVCWWSTAIAPAAKLSYWPEAPLSVWSSFVTTEAAHPPLVDALALEQVAPLTVRRHVKSDRAFGSALFTAHKAHRKGHAANAVLLAGSPFPHRKHRPMPLSPLLEGPLRQAWDGTHYFLPTHWSHAAPAAPPPKVGVLWELDIDEWQRFEEDNAPTFSRTLHFARRHTPTKSYTHHSKSLDSGWPDALSAAYAWAFHNRPVLECSQAANEKIFAFRKAGQEKSEALPILAHYFLVRDSDHVSRIAGTLAASEMTHIQGAHVDAAWSLVRRASLDTLELLQVSDSTARTLIAEMDDAIFGTTGTDTPEIPHPREKRGRKHSLRRTVRKTRDSSVARRIKQWYDGCQMCGETIRLPAPERVYAEAAHIQPLKGDDPGPDIIENILCLCANCHIRFDHGARVINDDLTVTDTLTGQELGALTVHPWHYIDHTYLRYHRDQWVTRIATSEHDQHRIRTPAVIAETAPPHDL